MPNQDKKTPLNAQESPQNAIPEKYSSFEYCPLIEKMCGFCGKDKYNPTTGKYDNKERLFCGLSPPSWDTRVSSLDECPKVMSNYEKSKHSRKKRDEYNLLRGLAK